MWTKEHHSASSKGEKIFINTSFQLLMFECGRGFEMMYVIFFLGPRFWELAKLLVLVSTLLHTAWHLLSSNEEKLFCS